MSPIASVKHVVIVGGGPAGWLAAAYLNRFLRPLGVATTLVESVKLGTSGIGDISDPALTRIIRTLRIDEDEFLKQTSATYQLGTKFIGWRGDGGATWQPFGLCGGKINDIDLFPFWLKSQRTGHTQEPFWSYSLQALLAEQNKAPRDMRAPSPIMERGDYAFHLDTAALADVFRELATGEGVNHLFDDVKNVVRGPSGGIEKIETKSGRSLAANLFLDCTSDGALIEKGLEDPWQSWSALLLCDRAVVLPLPRDPEMPPYVRATAYSAGWVQHFPLSHRTVCSYYYSSSRLTDDAAVRELLAGASPKRASAGEPRYVSLRTGRRTTYWVGNCVAVGPAAGSIEPLAGADMRLLWHSLESLVELFPDASGSAPLANLHNRRMTALYDTVRDFTLLHYLLAAREGDPFWRDSRAVAVPTSLETLMALHDDNGTVDAEVQRVYPEACYHHLFAGNERLPRRVPLAADSLDFAQVSDILGKMKAQNEEWLAKLPPHGELIKRLHRPPV